jgi:hypothetical protein
MLLVAVAALAAACGGGSDDDTSSPTLESDAPEPHDLAADVGFDEVTRTYGAVILDYDGDGDDDVLLGRHSLAAQLFRNDDGEFDVEHEFPDPDRHGCVAADIDDNGREDIFCTLGGHDGEKPKEIPNELWMQDDDGNFTDEGGVPELEDRWGRGRQAALFDADDDGDIDLFVGNSLPRTDGQPSTNRFFVNEGDGQWRSAPEFGLDLEWSIGSSGAGPPRGCLETFDANDDGLLDVLLCAKNPDVSPSPGIQRLSPRLFLNEGGERFVDVTDSAGLPEWMVDAFPIDLDDDGDTDLVSVDQDGLRIHLQDDGQLDVVHEQVIEGAFRVAVGDVNGDEHADLYVMRRRPGQVQGLPPPERVALEAFFDAGGEVGDVLLLGDGSLRDFERLDLPLPPGEALAAADDVLPLDRDGDGRSEFLVLNGGSDEPGPVQLIAYF